MRFSVVAPNFNEMPHIRDMFLESLVNQTFKDFEVIIVDGGSDDGCIEAIKEYYDRLKITIKEDGKRNIGYIRNVGAHIAKGELMVQTSSDIELPRDCLERLDREFRNRYDLCALGGRTIPHGEGNGVLCWLAYAGFDTLRWFYTTSVIPLNRRKFRPAGNFLCIPLDLFWELGGYPEVRINEDGLFGYQVDDYVRKTGKKAEFRLRYSVKHNVKRFKEKGALGAIKFYSYTLALMFPWLSRFIKELEEESAKEFADR